MPIHQLQGWSQISDLLIPFYNYILISFGIRLNIDKETHPILIIFILQSIIYIMGTRRYNFYTFKLRARLPKLIINSKLYVFWGTLTIEGIHIHGS
jgi:hypothetical protein